VPYFPSLRNLDYSATLFEAAPYSNISLIKVLSDERQLLFQSVGSNFNHLRH